MTDPQSPRYRLPLLALAQAQKELIHNEALAVIDMLLHPVAEGVASDPAGLVASLGQCWAIGTVPVGTWGGHAGELAGWTEGGWRFAPPPERMRLWNRATGGTLVSVGGAWQETAPVLAVGGGTTIDAEARAAIARLGDIIALTGLAKPPL